MPSLIGNKPNQVPSNGDLGTLAFQDASNPKVGAVVADSLVVDTNTLVVDSVNDRVGVGTSSPSEMLTVAGGIGSRVNTNANSNILVINSNTSSLATARFRLASDVVVGNLQANSSTGTPQLAVVCETAHPLTFLTNNTERMRIDSSGNVGIGTSSPATRLHVNGNVILGAEVYRSAATSYMRIAGGTEGAGANILAFGESHASAAGRLSLSSIGTGAIEFATGASPTERMRITSAGVLELTQGQIKFPATQVASADANTLDDYEEGTFTPTIVGGTTAGTGTYTVQKGTYTKVGNTVNIQIYVNWSAHTGTGAMSIGALPFTAQNTANLYNAITVGECNNISLTANNIMTCDITPNFTSIACLQYPAGGGAVSAVPIDTSGYLIVGGTYFV